MKVTKRQRDAAKAMLAELEAKRLVVDLAPSQRGQGSIRVVMEQNADWYQRFCRDYPAQRKHDRANFQTAISRKTTIKALRRLALGYDITEYTHRLLGYIPGFLADQKAQLKAERDSYRKQKTKLGHGFISEDPDLYAF